MIEGARFESHDMSGHYSPRSLLTVVFKRRRLIVLFVVIAVAGAVAVSLLRPKVYEARATLRVSGARADVALAPTESTQLVTQLSEEDLNSEVHALKSRQLIEQVVERLGFEDLQDDEGEHGSPGEGNGGVRSSIRSAPEKVRSPEFGQMVMSLSNAIRIDLVRKSNVIEVSYRSTDADWAARVVNTLTERYIEQRAEGGQAREAVLFFEGQMQVSEEKLNESEAVLENYLEANQFTLTKGPLGSDSLASQKALIIDRLALLRNEFGDAEADMEELMRKVEILRGRLNEEPERLQSSDRMNRDAATETIKRHLTDLELQRDALLQDFKPGSRYVQDIESQIKLARDRLAQLTAELGMIEGTELNPVHQDLKEELLRSEAELEGTRARHDTLARQVEKHTNELERLNDKAFELERIHRQALAAEEEYLLYRKKHEEARISAAMDKQKLINVTIAQSAQRPLTPVGEGLRTVLVLALLFGLLGGVGAAFALEFYLDRSFTTGEDMERRLGLVHLASIPEEL